MPRRIVAFVMPMGYSFNLDGSTLYLALASIFVAQAAGIHLGLGSSCMIVLTLMLTSKGVAGVPRATLVILAGTVASFGLPSRADPRHPRDRRADGHGAHHGQRHRQLPGHGGHRPLGGRVRGARHDPRSRRRSMRLGRHGTLRGIEPPPDALLQRVRVPLIERAALFREDDVEEVLLIDVGIGGAFVERREPLAVGESVEIHFRLPGNEIPVAAGCKVAWWRPSDATLGTRALPAGLGLVYTMSQTPIETGFARTSSTTARATLGSGATIARRAPRLGATEPQP